MKKTLLSMLMGSFFLTSCSKEEHQAPVNIPVPQQNIPLPCIAQTVNPAGKTYNSNSVLFINCTENHCGMLPLSANNYWVYEDSIFDNGTFLRTQLDTLRFKGNKRSVTDGLVWWESTVDVGLPMSLYANDSAFFLLQQRAYSPDYYDAKKDYSLFPGDSIRYLASFDDIAAQGRSLRMNTIYSTPAGDFGDWTYFEKNARNYRKDRVYFKRGIGVMKYIHEKAVMGSYQIKLQHIKTLVAFHIE